jgi:hypothetical protein
MPDDLKSALAEFVRFAQTLRGDEKSEAQSFLDHFFRALGHQGVIEAGATFEFRVAKKPGSPQLELITGNGATTTRPKGGKKFADLLWPDRVLIEMKSRGENLEKHYDQGFRLLDAHCPEAATFRHPLQLRRVLDLRLQHSALRSSGAQSIFPRNIKAEGISNIIS